MDTDITGQEGFPGEGPFMILHLKLSVGRVAHATFETYGCPSAIACGNWLTTWLVGKSHQDAAVIEPHDLCKVLNLPLGKEHCGVIAVKALRSALKQWP